MLNEKEEVAGMSTQFKSQFKTFLLLVALSSALAIEVGCASARKATSLKFKFLKAKSLAKDTSAKNVIYTPPPKPYRKQSHPELDALWWNNKNKSSISYLSSCSKESVQSLTEIQRQTLSQLENYRTLVNKRGKKSLYTIVEIKDQDNKKTMFALYTFKKQRCFYTLNLIAQSIKTFKAEQKVFDKFIQDFQG